MSDEAEHWIAIAVSEEVLADDKSTITAEGEKFVLTMDREYTWPTSSRLGGVFDGVPSDVRVFSSKAKAIRAAASWTPHPLWVRPSRFEFQRVKPKMVTKRVGWELSDE